MFDWVDFVTSNLMLPFGGLVVTIFAGYIWKNAAEEAGLTARWFKVWLFMLRYVAPILVLLVFLYSTGIIHFSQDKPVRTAGQGCLHGLAYGWMHLCGQAFNLVASKLEYQQDGQHPNRS